MVQNSSPRALRVAIVGRPNVGKSTLFNRLAGQPLALVADQPGVTRDRKETTTTFFGIPVTLIDTAGLEERAHDTLMAQMQGQTKRAMDDADVILFLIDGYSGVIPDDFVLAKLVRKTGLPVILIANKCEGKRGKETLPDAYRLGLGAPLPFSAAHGEGLSDLASLLGEHEQAPSQGPAPEENSSDKPLALAILGRPNVGKSTLINRLIGDDRLLTGPTAGLTRDAIAIPWSYHNRKINLIDTAGLRRRGKVTDALEKMGAADSFRAVRFAHVVILVLDALQALEKQDALLAEHVLKEGRGLILALNKWDQVTAPDALLKKIQHKVDLILPQAKGVTCLPVSALTGKGLESLIEAAFAVEKKLNTRIPTADLNRWLAEALMNHTPPLVKGRRLKIKYITQIKTRPPTFILFGNQMESLPESYLRYLTNRLRETFDLWGIPLRLEGRSSKNPYASAP